MWLKLLFWLSILLSIICALLLFIVASGILEMNSDESEMSAGFAIMFASAWLLLIGPATILAGGLGLVFSRGTSSRPKSFWIATVLGAYPLVGAFMPVCLARASEAIRHRFDSYMQCVVEAFFALQS